MGILSQVLERGYLRASDADREGVAERLRHAAAEGRLTPHELDERLGTALTARTYHELRAVVADLPLPPRARRVAPLVFYVAAVAVIVTLVLIAIAALAFIASLWLLWVAMGWALGSRAAHARLGRRRMSRRGIATCGDPYLFL